MKKLFALALVCLALPLSARAASEAVDKAVKALGGADALGKLKTLTIQGSAKHWEPGQSEIAGGEMRFAGDSTFTLSRDLGARSARTEWDRKLVYPAPREYKFTEVVVGRHGYVNGIDTTARTKQSLDSNPPAHSMSQLRATAAARELLRSSPALLLELQRSPAAVSSAPDVEIGGVKYPAVRYAADGFEFIALFDPASGLPARVRTLDFDPIQGDSNFDLVLSDWKDVAGVKIAHRQVYELNGKVVVEAIYQSVAANPALAAPQFEIPAQYVVADLPAGSPVPYQWVIRRQYAGTYLDSDKVSYDPGATQGLRLEELGPGVQITQGGTHNSTIVELADSLIVFDAPVSDAQSQWTLQAIKQKYPGKPVKYLVLTHHHIDHAAGLRSYVAEGATVVVGAGNADYVRRMLAAPNTRSPSPIALRGEPKITEVADQLALGDARRKVGVYRIDNPHAAGMLIGYVDDAKLGIVTDLWSPGRDPLPAQATPNLASVVNAVRKYGLAPQSFAGGHGKSAPYAPLAQLVGAGSGS